MKKISQPVVMEIPFPTDLGIDEQRRIVQKMDTLQQKIDAADRSQVESSIGLDALLPSILDHAFKGAL
jgi:type I restriction enzyme S subunit